MRREEQIENAARHYSMNVNSNQNQNKPMSSYTTEDYQALEAQLVERGYRRYTDHRISESHDWTYAKNVKDSNGDLMYLISFIVFDRSKWRTDDPMVKSWPYGVEVKVYVAHGCGLHLWNRHYTIDEAEYAAERFHELCTTLNLNHNPQ